LLLSIETKEIAMITDVSSQGNLIAALHLESLFNMGHAVGAQGLAIKAGMAEAVSSEKSRAAALRAAANVATWRTYLPDECVVAMINDRWHWST
jgi:hypothetical protein